MPRNPDSTEIHRVGLAPLVTKLVRMGWSAKRIARYAKYVESKKLTVDQVIYFRRRYVEEKEETESSHIKKDLPCEETGFNVLLERIEAYRMFQEVIEASLENEIEKGKEGFCDRRILVELRHQVDTCMQMLDAIEIGMNDTGRLAGATTGMMRNEEGDQADVQAKHAELVRRLVALGIDEEAAVGAVRTAIYEAGHPSQIEPSDACDRSR